MGKKLTKEEFLKKYKYVENSKFVDVVGEYHSSHEKIECVCKICGEHFYPTPSHLMQNHIHKNCAISIGKTSTLESFVNKLNKITKDIEIIGEYVSAKSKIKCRCKLCGKEFDATPNSLLNGCIKCRYCKQTKIDKNQSENINKKILEKTNKVLEKFPDIEFISMPKHLNEAALYKCKKCNQTYKHKLDTLIKFDRELGCTKCNWMRKLRKELDNIEKRLNITISIVNELEYKNEDTCLICKCNVCGYTWDTKVYNIRKLRLCINCDNRRNLSHEEYVQKLKKLNPQVELLSEYKNQSTKIYVHCNKCDTSYYILPKKAEQCRCQGCANIILRNKFAKTTEEFRKEVFEKYSEYEVLGEYVNAHTKIEIKHNVCEKTFMFNPGNIYNEGVHICPFCYPQVSIGERAIQHYLKVSHIEFVTQKTFQGLLGINGGFLSYDFYIEKYNLLIEFQGLQHFESVEAFGGNEQFEIQKEHDRRKREYAQLHNINLLEIKYNEIDCIEEILSKYLTI